MLVSSQAVVASRVLVEKDSEAQWETHKNACLRQRRDTASPVRRQFPRVPLD